MDYMKIFETLQGLECETYYNSIRTNDPADEAAHDAIKEALQVVYHNFIEK